MILTLKRFLFLEKCTIGRLSIDRKEVGIFTLEDKVREVKIFGETAIPFGVYKVIVDYSEHFEKELPHILDVPGFTGIRIHCGNSDVDTEGCLLVGKTWLCGDFIGQSKEAFDELFPLIRFAKDVILEVTR